MRRGGEALVKVEQVQPWAGGGVGYLSQGTQEGEGWEGELELRYESTRSRKILSQWQCCPYQTYDFSDPPVSLILAPIVWMKGLKLFCR